MGRECILLFWQRAYQANVNALASFFPRRAIKIFAGGQTYTLLGLLSAASINQYRRSEEEREMHAPAKTQQKWCTSGSGREEELGLGHVGGGQIRLIKSRAGWLIEACHIQSRLTPIALRTSVEPSAFCIKHATQPSHSDGEQAKRLPSSQFPLRCQTLAKLYLWDALVGGSRPEKLLCWSFACLEAVQTHHKTTPPLSLSLASGAQNCSTFDWNERQLLCVDVRCVFPELIVRREPETVKYCN